MAKEITLADLKYQSRLRADKVGSTYIKEDELLSYINKSGAELYDLLIGAYGNDYYLKEAEFKVQHGVSDYDLPEDFYKLLGVDFQITQQRKLTLKPYMFNERNRYQEGAYWSAVIGISGPRYHLQNNQIKFRPTPDGAYTLVLHYIPCFTDLVEDTDVLNGVNGWEEYIILDAAIKMLMKEESDTSGLERQRDRILLRINTMAENRDASQSFKVNDVQKDWINIEGDTYRY